MRVTFHLSVFIDVGTSNTVEKTFEKSKPTQLDEEVIDSVSNFDETLRDSPVCVVCQCAYSGKHSCQKCKMPCHPWHGKPVEEKYAGMVICHKCEPPGYYENF